MDGGRSLRVHSNRAVSGRHAVHHQRAAQRRVVAGDLQELSQRRPNFSRHSRLYPGKKNIFIFSLKRVFIELTFFIR